MAINVGYPIVFIIFMLLFLIIRVKEVLDGFLGICYLSQNLTKWITKIYLLTIVWIIGELICYVNILLFKENLIIFIIAFFTFLVWLTQILYKYKLKKIIIDSDKQDEIS